MERVSDIEAKVSSCDGCGALYDSRVIQDGEVCKKCGAKVYSRHPNSLIKTWSLVLSALFLYIPANLYPIMEINFLGISTKSTIISGVIDLFSSHMYFVGGVVLVASIVVPLIKIIGIFYILISIHRGSKKSLKEKTKMYKIITFIGRWSMIDVFVVSLIIALINFGNLASITPQVGIIFFSFVVILTMIGANSLDSRLIWDAQEPSSTGEKL